MHMKKIIYDDIDIAMSFSLWDSPNAMTNRAKFHLDL